MRGVLDARHDSLRGVVGSKLVGNHHPWEWIQSSSKTFACRLVDITLSCGKWLGSQISAFAFNWTSREFQIARD